MFYIYYLSQSYVDNSMTTKIFTTVVENYIIVLKFYHDYCLMYYKGTV